MISTPELPLCARRAGAGSANLRSVDHASVLSSVVRWAESDANVQVVVLEGSLARDDPSSVDRLSDLDIRLYVKSPEPLARLVYYVDGKVDFMIAPVGSLVARARQVYRSVRGMIRR